MTWAEAGFILAEIRMSNDLDEHLQATLRRFITDPEEWEAVRGGEPLLEATGLDSLSVMNLITELELLFDVRFSPDTLEQTLQDIHSLTAFLKGFHDRKS
jgi:acyl carrier protein